MTRQRLYLVIAVISSIASGWGACYVAAAQRDAALRRNAELAAEIEGWTKAKPETPKIEDVPKGAEPKLTAKWTIQPSPAVAAVRAGVVAPPPTSTAAAGGTVSIPASEADQPGTRDAGAESFTPTAASECWTPLPSNLGGECRLEIVRAGRQLYGKAWWTGVLNTPEGQIVRGPEEAKQLDMTADKELTAWAASRKPLLQLGITTDIEPLLGFHWPIQRGESRFWNAVKPDWFGAQASVDVYDVVTSDFYYSSSSEERSWRGALMVTYQMGRK